MTALRGTKAVSFNSKFTSPQAKNGNAALQGGRLRQPTNRQYPLLRSQQALGNQLVRRLLDRRLIQTKMTIGRPNDRFEQEADRVADEVMRMPGPQLAAPAAVVPSSDSGVVQILESGTISSIHRACSACEEELQRQPATDEEELLQREPEEEKEWVHKSKNSRPAPTPQVTPSVESGIQALKGSGRPLPNSLRGFFEPRFGADFSQVRVHTDARAHHIASSINARAFTIDSNIAFAHGQFAQNREGYRMLAHELTHVVQQGSGQQAVSHAPDSIQRACGKPEIGKPKGCTVPPDYGHFRTGGTLFLMNVNCDTFATGEDGELADFARRLPQGATVEIHGYASVDGPEEFNHNLACARARAAASFLTDPGPIGGGLSAGQVKGVFNHGESPGPAVQRRGVSIETSAPMPPPKPKPALKEPDRPAQTECKVRYDLQTLLRELFHLSRFDGQTLFHLDIPP